MPLFVNNASTWEALSPEDVHIKDAGTYKSVVQGWVKDAGAWKPLWSLAPATARWGLAQFSDTDFTGGKSDPNQAGDPYESWTGVQDFIDSELTNVITPVTDGQIITTVAFPLYVYLAIPKSEGFVTFTDDDTGFAGGFNGAAWGDGGTPSTSGPVTVSYNDGTGVVDWYVYRSDFSGIGSQSWTLSR